MTVIVSWKCYLQNQSDECNLKTWLIQNIHVGTNNNFLAIIAFLFEPVKTFIYLLCYLIIVLFSCLNLRFTQCMHYILRCSFPEDLNCSGFFTANILLKLAVLFHFHKEHSGQLSCSLVYIVCEYISTYPFAGAAADVHTYLLCICMEVKFGNAMNVCI